VTFGESALDEMCFIGGYYYPGNGFDLRIQGGDAQGVVGTAHFSDPDGGAD
jgi:hypothetical protein